ncbi:unnamed protein product, partial [Discosporangium mesarthrocarpum]
CPVWENKTCGSDFDRLGNPRFIQSAVPYGFDRMRSSTYYEDFNWGFTIFDNFPRAILTVSSKTRGRSA